MYICIYMYGVYAQNWVIELLVAPLSLRVHWGLRAH